jgi:hypothetical protein
MDEKRIEDLERRVKELEAENERLKELASSKKVMEQDETIQDIPELPNDGLSPTHIERYSRQLLLRGGFRVEGQRKLLSSSVLIVGAGGIGSTGKAGSSQTI